MAEVTTTNALYKTYSCMARVNDRHWVSLEAYGLSALARVLKERMLFHPTEYPCQILFSWNRLRGGRVDRGVEVGSRAQLEEYLSKMWSKYLPVEVEDHLFFTKGK